MSAHTPAPWTVNEFELSGDIAKNYIFIEPNIAVIERKVEGHDQHDLADAHLIAAAPALLEAQTMGASMNTPDFLDWIADRLVHQNHENPNVDYVLSLRERAAAGRAAIAKATGVPA